MSWSQVILVKLHGLQIWNVSEGRGQLKQQYDCVVEWEYNIYTFSKVQLYQQPKISESQKQSSTWLQCYVLCPSLWENRAERPHRPASFSHMKIVCSATFYHCVTFSNHHSIVFIPWAMPHWCPQKMFRSGWNVLFQSVTTIWKQALLINIYI